MFLLLSRFALFLLLVADWAGDPYFGHSPLSRPYASRDAFCHSLVQRATLLKATTAACNEFPILHAQTDTLPSPRALSPVHVKRGTYVLLPATDPVYALKSLQC
jgi:hypothetical protein